MFIGAPVIIILDFALFVHSLIVENDLTKVRIVIIYKNPVSDVKIRYGTYFYSPNIKTNPYG